MEGNCCFVGPLVGNPAPDFKGMAYHKSFGDSGFKGISLSDYQGKWLVLYFYPLDFTAPCMSEITAFSKASTEFASRGAELLGASVDSHFSHQALDKSGNLGELRMPLLSDLTKQISASYHVLTASGFALRGLFIIDPDGIVQYTVTHNPGTGRSVDETLRVLDALQSGGVCPANWKKGDANI